MSTPLKQFTGFRGVAAMAQIGDLQFVILAPNHRQLDILWSSLLPAAGPLDPRGVKKSILIASDLVPAPTTPPIRPMSPIIEHSSPIIEH
jgi:hypothetical protein